MSVVDPGLPMRRLAFADDSPAVRLLVRTIFTLEPDFEIVGEAATGAEIVQIVADGVAPSVVILDLGMPDMDGLEALARMLELSPELRVVIYSGYSDARVEAAARNLGAADFVVKGVTPGELVRRVRAVVER